MKNIDGIVNSPGRGSDVQESNDVGQTQKDHQQGMYGEEAGVKVAQRGSRGGGIEQGSKPTPPTIDQNISIDEKGSWDGQAKDRDRLMAKQ